MKKYEIESLFNLAEQNASVIDWAKQNFPKGYDLKRFDFFLLTIILISPMFGLSVILFIDALFSEKTGKVPALFVSLVLFALLSFLIFKIFMARRRTVIYLDMNGVKTRTGKIYQWSNLHYVEFIPVAQRVRYFGIRMRFKPRIRAELFFDDGRASVLASDELKEILETIPCQVDDRRGDLFPT